MSSSFRRRTASNTTVPSAGGTSEKPSPVSSQLLPGTKPWTGGVTLTSVGLRELDSILGGGQPLGTCLLLEHDRWTPDLALCLTRYWWAEAEAQGQQVSILTSRPDDKYSSTALLSRTSLSDDDDESSTSHEEFRVGASNSQVQELLRSLPRNLHHDKQERDEQSNQERDVPLEVLQEEEEGDEEAAEEGLQIAWQYKKTIQEQRMGHDSNKTVRSSAQNKAASKVFCHSYDLSGRMAAQQEKSEGLRNIFDCHCCCKSSLSCATPRQCGFDIFQRLLKHVKETTSEESSRVMRILWPLAPVSTTSVALPLLLAYVRAHLLPVVVLVTIQPWTCPTQSSLISLRRTSDVVIQTRGFVSRVHYPPPPEFSHLHGLILLPKVSTVTGATAHGSGHFADMTSNKRPPAHVYGLKRDRRKLHISLLHIPPEDYAGGGGSVGGSGVRSGAGRTVQDSSKRSGEGCGSTGSSLLDF